jgi:hypothetical protein
VATSKVLKKARHHVVLEFEFHSPALVFQIDGILKSVRAALRLIIRTRTRSWSSSTAKNRRICSDPVLASDAVDRPIKLRKTETTVAALTGGDDCLRRLYEELRSSPRPIPVSKELLSGIQNGLPNSGHAPEWQTVTMRNVHGPI